MRFRENTLTNKQNAAIVAFCFVLLLWKFNELSFVSIFSFEFLGLGFSDVITWQEVLSYAALWGVLFIGAFFCYDVAQDEGWLAGILAAVLIMPLSYFFGLIIAFFVGVFTFGI